MSKTVFCRFNNVSTLVFHSVREKVKDDLFAISPARFEKLVAFIKKRFNVLDFQEIQKGKMSRNISGKKDVLFTFDDGYKDNYEYVFPILQKYGIKGLFFILPKYIGLNNLWNRRAKVVLNHLNRAEIQLLLKYGHSIGSHGLTHHRLTKFDDEVIFKELNDSKQLLEDMFGVEINSFAYPYGAFNLKVIQIAGKIYDYCFATNEVFSNDTKHACRIRREYIWPHNTQKEVANVIIHFGSYENSPYRR